MPGFCRKIRQSLFTKLAIVLVLGVMAINGVIMSLYVSQKREHDTTLNQALVLYAQDLADQVGNPPDKTKAQALLKSRVMRITLEGSNSWTVGGIKRRFPERFLKPRFSQDGIDILNIHENYRLRVPTGDGSVLIFDLHPTKAARSALRQFGLFTLLGSCLIMLTIYLALRYFLRPIKWLKAGAASIRDGKLETRVKEHGSSELKELSETFNQMAVRLETLVGGQRDLMLGVSHELRTPLTRLKLRLEMLDGSVDTTAIRKDILQMESMITSLLDTAKMHREADGLEISATDMNALLGYVAAGFSHQEPGIKTIFAGRKIMGDVDQEKISMALSILLDNALKYSGTDSPPVELTLKERSGGFIIAVKDYGIGIPRKSIKHLFEPFYRVDSSRTRETGGYGLGLYLFHAIIKAHGADVEVISSMGVGTEFVIKFGS